MAFITTTNISKASIACLFENLAFLLSVRFTACDAVERIIESAYKSKKRDKKTKGMIAAANLLIGDLREGCSLSTAMENHSNVFGKYAKQVEASENSGQTPEMLERMAKTIEQSANTQGKIRAALAYPAFVFVLTLVIAWYLFSNVLPDMLKTLTDISGNVASVPATTKLVMQISEFTQQHGLAFACFVGIVIVVWVVLSKGPLKLQFAKLYATMPLIGSVISNNNITIYLNAMRYVLYANTPMAQALKTAAEAVPNLFIKTQAANAYYLYSTAGVSLTEAMLEMKFLTSMELSTISVGADSGRIVEVLDRLAERRQQESNKSIQSFVSALNPIIICFLGVIVGVIVLGAYSPLINISKTFSA